MNVCGNTLNGGEPGIEKVNGCMFLEDPMAKSKQPKKSKRIKALERRVEALENLVKEFMARSSGIKYQA